MPAASAMRTASAVGAETAADDDGRADGSRFLYHLDRHAARQQHHALLRGRTLSRQRAGKLVEGVVASDVLAHGDEAAARIEEAGAMHRAGHVFHISANGVWLTDAVPPEFLRLPS